MDLFQPRDGCEIIGLKFISGETRVLMFKTDVN